MSHHQSLLKQVLESSSSDEDDEFFFGIAQIVHNYGHSNGSASKHRGSVVGHIVIDREREEGHKRLHQDYFTDEPTYGPTLFRRRFRMSRHLYLRIMHAVKDHDDYFVQKRNAAGKLGLSCLQKITAAFCMLAYGVSADATDEKIYIAESTAIESLKRFVKAVVEVFENEYLRAPNDNDTAQLLALGEKRRFPGMLGSIDCMHWKWKNCPSAWQGMCSDHMHELTIILEAVASHDLWIWHAIFSLPGSHNDINVFHRSPLFSKLAKGQAPKVGYNINGHDYTMGYYLADDIYPSWATFVKTIQEPQGNKRKYFAKAQEAVRKDVERAFGVLQARFAIVRGPTRFWDEVTLEFIMKACVIIHNMIIEDEGEVDIEERFELGGETVTPFHDPIPDLEVFIKTHKKIRGNETHSQLQEDLVEHLWQHYLDKY